MKKLEIEGLCKSFGKQKIFDNFSLTVNQGEKTGIFGISGRGKSTLFKIISEIENKYSGKVSNPFTVSMAFQANTLFPWLTSLENVSAVGDAENAKALLEKLGLGDCLSKYPSELSGGMQRRAELARCLNYPSELYLFDEPFSGLDKGNIERAKRVINECCKDKTIMVITHNESDFEGLCDRIINI